MGSKGGVGCRSSRRRPLKAVYPQAQVVLHLDNGWKLDTLNWFLTRDNTYAYFRYIETTKGTEAVFVYLNNNPEPRQIPWDDYKEITRKLDTFDGYDVVTGESVNFEEPLTVAGRSALVVHLPYNEQRMIVY